jgi:hypothetical protein
MKSCIKLFLITSATFSFMGCSQLNNENMVTLFCSEKISTVLPIKGVEPKGFWADYLDTDVPTDIKNCSSIRDDTICVIDEFIHQSDASSFTFTIVNIKSKWKITDFNANIITGYDDPQDEEGIITVRHGKIDREQPVIDSPIKRLSISGELSHPAFRTEFNYIFRTENNYVTGVNEYISLYRDANQDNNLELTLYGDIRKGYSLTGPLEEDWSYYLCSVETESSLNSKLDFFNSKHDEFLKAEEDKKKENIESSKSTTDI